MIELQMDEEHRELFYDLPEDRAGTLMSIKMLEHNKIPGLLPLYQQHVDDKLRLSYEIGSRISIQKQYEYKEISVKRACQLIKMVIDIILAGEQFFMMPEEYCVDFSYIYLERGEKQLYLCYLPDVEQTFPLEFRRLLEFLMEHLDHRDKKAASFYYAFYDMYCADELSLIELAEHIRLFEQENRNNTEERNSTYREQGAESKKTPNTRKQMNVQKKKVSDDINEEDSGEDTKYIFSLSLAKSLLAGKQNLWTEILPKQLTFSQGKYMVGRQEGSAFHLLAPQVSRRHAEIEITGGQAYITDQGSRNGTYVNGRKLSAYVKTRLQAGDRVRFADISYQLRSPAEQSEDAVSRRQKNTSLHIHDIAGSLRQRFSMFH